MSNNPIIIDRRKNPGKKSLSNRQRFMERFRDKIKESARKNITQRSVTDTKGQNISVSGKGISEPQFRHNPNDGNWDYVLPGNKDFVPGDHINKPKGGSGSQGKEGGIGAEGEDDFEFLLSYDEYLDVIFDDLELPDLIKKSEKTITSHQMRRAGITTSGVPTNLNVERTAIAGLSRRIALKYPKDKEIAELELLLESETDEDERKRILEEIEILRSKSAVIPHLDKVDLRYNNFIPQPKPIMKAVMFCIMDVSFSMGEKEKIIAKKFFILLHLFLKRRYKDIDVVFVRHHEKANECTEEDFFNSKESGGTVVSTAYEVTQQIIKDRYGSSEWNIYIAQVSDGDNYSSDNNKLKELMHQVIPLSQFMAYVEIGTQAYDYMYHSETNLWEAIKDVSETLPQIAMNKVQAETEIISVFRKFFSKD